jgi:hypothetical protein
MAPVDDIATGTSPCVHISIVYRHRGAKAQPGGICARFGGAPGIVSSTLPRSPPCTVEASNPLVYGCRGVRMISRADAVSTKLLAQAHAIVVDEAPWLFIVHDLNPRAMSKKVTGFHPAQSWYQDFTQISMV